MPDTRPDLRIDDRGICSACRAYEKRPNTNWSGQAMKFAALMKEHRGTHPVYDCVIGSSGGKDSTYIVLKALELGYHPLVVTATTDFPTDIGQRNIQNLKNIGVDTLEFTANPVVRRKLNRIALAMVGDIEWPEHALIFGIPVRIAQDMGIGVVLYGENPQSEYSGGPQDAIVLDRRWREEFGGLLGLRPKDLVGVEGLTSADLWPYEYPPDTATPARGVFIGQFYEWQGWKNALFAQAHGFITYPRLVEGNLSNAENLDNAIVGIHDYFGFLKFGFGRATVMASLLIRRGQLTRDEGVQLSRLHDGAFPFNYLGVPLGRILDAIDMPQAQWMECVDRFANTNILDKTDGYWFLKEPIA
jgi:N-acetyl sugar amidotransferase